MRVLPGLLIAIPLVLASPSHAVDACAPIQQIVSALKVQGYDSIVVQERPIVEKGMAFLETYGLPRGTIVDGFLIVRMPQDELRVSFIRAGCVVGMILLDAPTSKAFLSEALGEVPGRDA